MPKHVAITTIDNPFDPFEQFNDWYMFDVLKGYNTCAYLSRVANVPEKVPEAVEVTLTEDAIDEIIENDFLHIYKKVVTEG